MSSGEVLESPDDHLVFGHTIHELFVKILGSRLDAAARAELATAGLDLSRPLLPAYPLRVVDALMNVAARRLYPELSLDEAHLELGHLQVEAFTSTLLGAATLAMMRLLPVNRVLERTTRSWRNANNFVETRLTPLGKTSCEVWINDVGRTPLVTAGILRSMMHKLGQSACTVTVLGRDGLSARYRLDW